MGPHYVVVAARVKVEERGLPSHRARGQCGGGRLREALHRYVAGIAREDLVPHSVAPGVQLSVADQELLLRAVDDCASRELRIRDEAAAGEAGVAVVEEEEQTVDVNRPDRRGLGDRVQVLRVGADAV